MIVKMITMHSKSIYSTATKKLRKKLNKIVECRYKEEKDEI